MAVELISCFCISSLQITRLQRLFVHVRMPSPPVYGPAVTVKLPFSFYITTIQISRRERLFLGVYVYSERVYIKCTSGSTKAEK